MLDIKNNNNNLKIVNNVCTSSNISLINDFLDIVKYLYSHVVFKDILDLVVTKCNLGQLKFVVQNAKFFDIDHGNCVTMVSDEGIANAAKYQRKYIITIKKIASDVIMHEIGHMLEHELRHLIQLSKFASILMYEVNASSIYMQPTVKSLFIDQVNGYEKNQHISELFARFFQFFAGANEYSYQSSLSAKYQLRDALNTFPRTLEFLNTSLSNNFRDLIDPLIAKTSHEIFKITTSNKQSIPSKNQFTDKQIKPLGRILNSIKSNKDDPFK